MQSRRSVKDDNDLWSGVRKNKPLDLNDHERATRKHDDRGFDQDDEDGRDGMLQTDSEHHRGNGKRETNGDSSERRGALPRNRTTSHWQDRNHAISDEWMENTRPKERSDKDRRGVRASDRDWTRNGRQELDPEWMDKNEAEEQNHGSEPDSKIPKTEDDFKQFLARMKAGNRPSQELQPTRNEPKTTHDRNSSGAGAGAAKGKVDTPLVLNSSFDGFFGLLDRPKNDKDDTIEAGNGVLPVGARTAVKVPKSSKFSNLFKEEKVKDSEPTAAERPSNVAVLEDSSNEDKAGFQRILKLLDQQQQQPGGREVMAPRTHSQQYAQASPPVRSPRGEEQNDLSKLLESRQTSGLPPAKASPQSNSDFFQNLMQKPQANRQEFSQATNRRLAQDTGLDVLKFSNLAVSSFDAPQQVPATGPPPGFFSESTKDDLPRDKLNPNAGLDRRAVAPGFPDMPAANTQRHPSSGFQSSSIPPGMQRPPGLEQHQTGFAHQAQQSQQNVGPPPGFHPPRAHSGYPPVLPPGLISPPIDRGMHYGIRANGPGMPPPGFMGGPSTAYMQYGQDSLPYGGFDGGQFGQGFLPQQRRP